jgi:hypothetical protein
MIESKEVWYKYLDHCKTMSKYTDDYEVTEVFYGRRNQIGENDHHTITCSFIGKGEEEGLICHKYIHIDEKRFKVW